MSDTAPIDPLDVLRQLEAELQQEAHDVCTRLETVRHAIGRCAVKQRAARRPRAPALAAPDGGPQPIAAGLERALDRLGDAVRANAAGTDAALPEAA